MGLKVDKPTSITGVGYYRTSVLDAEGVLGHVIDHDRLEEDQPSYNRYDDATTFRVTVTVEEV